MTFRAPDAFTTRPTLRGTFGMSASTHWLASGTGQAVLERGGNAFDAAVASAFVLHVVEPHLNGPGGDMTAVVHVAGEDAPKLLMGQGSAPAAATPERFREEGLDRVPGAGALAAAVPAAVDAWLLLLRDHGTWELADVWAFAIGYARDGHPMLERVSRTIASVADLFREHWTASAAFWMPGGEAPVADSLVMNPAWAASLERILAEASAAAGPDATREDRIEAARTVWAEGFVAEEMVASAREPHRHSTGADHAGLLTAEDLASSRASWEDPVSIGFRGLRIWKTDAWGQGPALLQALMILDGFTDDEIDPATAAGIHRIIEAQKLALADREAYYGDAVPGGAPLDVLLSAEYAAGRRALIADEASHELRPGRVDGVEPFLPPLVVEGDAPASAGGTGEPTVSRVGETRGDTCHLDVVDRFGNMISATPSGGWLQSSPFIPALGFCLGTRLQMTWLEPGGPSSLVPGRRPRTTLTPTLVTRDGEPVEALGSPGGDQQDQWQLPYLLRTIVGGFSPQEAVDAPTFHTTSVPGSFWPRTWTPGGLVVEGRVGDDVIADLRARGHEVEVVGDWTLGRLSAVTRDPATGLLGAAANPRGAQGYAVGR
ncbi:gamma-glutamyltransferase family protein [Clavibacter sp. Sh2141]|uniref:gamma-glutamyltransferase family protein n=1 Tax=Clavibacter sp. Sh2141 TaxID=3395374 RepID=UPI0039BD5541